MTKLTRAEFIARAVADRRKDKLRGQKEAYWVRSAHMAETGKTRKQKYPDFKIVQKQGGLNQ